METEQEQIFGPLDAVASILVLDDEVTAACYISEAITVVVTNQLCAETDLDTPLDSFPALSTPRALYPLQVAAVSNPQFKHNLTGNASKTNPNPHRLRALGSEDAKDFWPELMKDEWHCAFG